MSDPVPPEDVRLIYGDGTVRPCEVFYVGTVDGVHEWQVTADMSVLFDVLQGEDVRIEVGKMPPHTALAFTVGRSRGDVQRSTIYP